MESVVFGSPSENTFKGKTPVQGIKRLSRNFLQKESLAKTKSVVAKVNAAVSKYTFNLTFYKNTFL